MEQSPSPTSKPKVSKLAVVGLILSLFPIYGGIPLVGLVLRNVISFSSSIILIICASLAGIGLEFLTLFFIKQRKSHFSINSIVIGFFLLLLWMKAGPNFISMKYRVMDADVKVVAQELQLAVEAFQKEEGRTPARVVDIETLLPLTVKNKKNPFNPKEFYTSSSGGLVDGRPSHIGQVGYIAPQSQSESYIILTFPKIEGNTFRLPEESPRKL